MAEEGKTQHPLFEELVHFAEFPDRVPESKHLYFAAHIIVCDTCRDTFRKTRLEMQKNPSWRAVRTTEQEDKIIAEIIRNLNSLEQPSLKRVLEVISTYGAKNLETRRGPDLGVVHIQSPDHSFSLQLLPDGKFVLSQP